MTMDPETARKVAEVLADYDDVVETWREANDEAEREDEAPSVRSCEQYSDGLERVAHDLVAVLRPAPVGCKFCGARADATEHNPGCPDA